jgi:hypothetical protein
MQIVYLYGFASGPFSDKAQFFKKKFTSVGSRFQIFDYLPNIHEFSNMKISQLHKNLHKYLKKHFRNEKVTLFGSSFGGLLAAMYAHLHPEKVNQLILIAPALHFTPEFITQTLSTSLSKWKVNRETLVDHYRFNERIPLEFSFIQDLKENPVPTFSATEFPVQTLIFHGNHDETVPPTWSVDFAHSNPKVKAHILNGDHQLLDQKERIWDEIRSELEIK